MLEMSINIIEWPSLQYCTICAFRGDALQRKAMSHKLSFIIIDVYQIQSKTNHTFESVHLNFTKFQEKI